MSRPAGLAARSATAVVALAALLTASGCIPLRLPTPQAATAIPTAIPTANSAATTTQTPPQRIRLIVPADGYGFGDGSSILYNSAADNDRELDAVALTNASWLRVEINWYRIEKSRGVFDWGYLDHIVDAARARNLKVLGMIAFTPDWAREPGTFFTAPPVNAADFAQFAVAVVQRYHDRVSDWEIWNEPNYPLFWGRSSTDAAGYTELLKAAYSAIKTVQPDSTVLAAGLTPTTGDDAPPAYLAAMYAAGAKGYFDAAAMHPYVFPGGMSADPQNGWSDVARVHDLMVSNGDGDKKIWMTEVGAPTSDPSAEGATQQEQIRQISDILWASSQTGYSGPAFIFSIRDVDTSQRDELEDNFGTLLTSDWQPKFAASILAR
jgi:hypothetical protein